MKKLKIITFAAFCLLLTGFAREVQARSYANDEKEIAVLLDRYVAAANAKNIDEMMKLFVPDVFVFDVYVPRQAVGTAAYRKNWEGILTHENFKLSISDLSITTDGRLAYSHSINRTSGVAPDGKAYDTISRVTDAFRKINGRWFIVMEHWSWPVDPNTGRADFLSEP